MLAHIDGDAFFASVEQSLKPWLKGKPVVTGAERNIVAAASYEAKEFGVKRGVTLWDAKKMCPELVVLPTDCESVSLFSKRMYDIMRRYTPSVEEYSVDEGFIDLKGMRRFHHASYEMIGERIRHDIESELGITVTIGIAKTKTLCKLASSLVKPNGLKLVRELDHVTDYPIEDVWNIGPATAALLKKFGMHTAQQFAHASEERVRKLLTKPGVQTWRELNGNQEISFEREKVSYQTIGKTKTFTPCSDDKEFVFSQLMKNLENACMKARRYHQGAKKIIIYIRRKDYSGLGMEGKIERATAFPNDLTQAVREMYEKIFSPALYRSTSVLLCDLVPLNPIQPTLFEDPARLVRMKKLYAAVDILREHYGKHAVHSATTLQAQRNQHASSRGKTPVRKELLVKGESKRRRLPIPMLQVTLG